VRNAGRKRSPPTPRVGPVVWRCGTGREFAEPKLSAAAATTHGFIKNSRKRPRPLRGRTLVRRVTVKRKKKKEKKEKKKRKEEKKAKKKKKKKEENTKNTKQKRKPKRKKRKTKKQKKKKKKKKEKRRRKKKKGSESPAGQDGGDSRRTRVKIAAPDWCSTATPKTSPGRVLKQVLRGALQSPLIATEYRIGGS